jgi:hypothetical protein
MSDQITQLAEVVSDLVLQVNRLTVRLNVALALLAEARLTGSPDNADLIAERMAAAEAQALAMVSGKSTMAPPSLRAASFGAVPGIAPPAAPMSGGYIAASDDEPTSSGRPAATVTERVITTTDDGRVFTHEVTRREERTEQVVSILEDLVKRK